MTWSFWSGTFPTNLLPRKPSVNSADSIHLHTYLPSAFGPGTRPIFQLYLAGIHYLWANKHISSHEQNGRAKSAAVLNTLLELVFYLCIAYSKTLQHLMLLKSVKSVSKKQLYQCSVFFRLFLICFRFSSEIKIDLVTIKSIQLISVLFRQKDEHVLNLSFSYNYIRNRS